MARVRGCHHHSSCHVLCTLLSATTHYTGDMLTHNYCILYKGHINAAGTGTTKSCTASAAAETAALSISLCKTRVTQPRINMQQQSSYHAANYKYSNKCTCSSAIHSFGQLTTTPSPANSYELASYHSIRHDARCKQHTYMMHDASSRCNQQQLQAAQQPLIHTLSSVAHRRTMPAVVAAPQVQ